MTLSYKDSHINRGIDPSVGGDGQVDSGSLNSICSYKDICSGCDYWDVPYSEQIQLKSQELKSLVNEPGLQIDFISAGSSGLRDRIDFRMELVQVEQSEQSEQQAHQGAPHKDLLPIAEQQLAELSKGIQSHQWHLGLLDKSKTKLLDLEECLQMSPKLAEFYKKFRQTIALNPWPIKKASFRLRVSPEGECGVWLDCANIDVKHLLDSQKELLQLLQITSVVEIGQRRKRLVCKETGQGNYILKLVDFEAAPWFSTLGPDSKGDLQKIPLFCTVGSFTQAGYKINHLMVQKILDWVGEVKPRSILELGSGIGNFTIPLASQTLEKVIAVESDAMALAGLKRTLSEHTEFEKKVSIYQQSYEKLDASVLAECDIIFVDPPRSGLGKFVDKLHQAMQQKPQALAVAQKLEALAKHFIYVSCFPESFATDMAKLKTLGYQIHKLAIVDQFPQSKHYEILCWLKR